MKMSISELSGMLGHQTLKGLRNNNKKNFEHEFYPQNQRRL